METIAYGLGVTVALCALILLALAPVAAFYYGRKRRSPRLMVVGAVLAVLVLSAVLNYFDIGGGVTLALGRIGLFGAILVVLAAPFVGLWWYLKRRRQVRAA